MSTSANLVSATSLYRVQTCQMIGYMLFLLLINKHFLYVHQIKPCINLPIVIRFFVGKTFVFDRKTKRVIGMQEKDKYYVVKQKALPEVLLKVVEAKRLLESQKAMTVQEATDKVELSRSSFYKYKDDIFPFRDNTKGKTVTFVIQIDDEPGLLSQVLGKIADYKANVLTIHQTIPINGIASLTLSIDILNETGNSSHMIEEIEHLVGVHYLKILSRE